MFNFVAKRLVRAGLGERRAEVLAPWVAAVAVIALLLALWAISWPVRAIIDSLNDNKAVIEDRRAANLDALQGQAKADAAAAETRVGDAVTQAEQERDYVDAIENPAPGADPDPGVRLACERLRRSGKDISQLPSCR